MARNALSWDFSVPIFGVEHEARMRIKARLLAPTLLRPLGIPLVRVETYSWSNEAYHAAVTCKEPAISLSGELPESLREILIGAIEIRTCRDARLHARMGGGNFASSLSSVVGGGSIIKSSVSIIMPSSFAGSVTSQKRQERFNK